MNVNLVNEQMMNSFVGSTREWMFICGVDGYSVQDHRNLWLRPPNLLINFSDFDHSHYFNWVFGLVLILYHRDFLLRKKNTCDWYCNTHILVEFSFTKQCQMVLSMGCVCNYLHYEFVLVIFHCKAQFILDYCDFLNF